MQILMIPFLNLTKLINCIIDFATTPHEFILEDFNANINFDSFLEKELIEFCDIN